MGTHQNGLLMTIQCIAAAKKTNQKQLNSVLIRLAISLDKRNCGVGCCGIRLRFFLFLQEKKCCGYLS